MAFLTVPKNTARDGRLLLPKFRIVWKTGYIEQAKQARSAEQKSRLPPFAERQTKCPEEEKQNTEKTVAAMRLELNRLRHYAAAQNRNRNLPATTTAATASDGASDSQGWLLFDSALEKICRTGRKQPTDMQPI